MTETNRRTFLTGLFSFAAASHIFMPGEAEAARKKKKRRKPAAKPFKLDPKFAPQNVLLSGYKPGTIVIDTKNHFLYFVTAFGLARRYGVGVGKAGLAFKGKARIGRKAKWPFWKPTANMIRRNPKKYAKYAKGVAGGRGNPLGSRALYLYRGSRDTMFRIHGTTAPRSIGRSVSNGCIRMINSHVEDLFDRVPVGTIVVVI